MDRDGIRNIIMKETHSSQLQCTVAVNDQMDGSFITDGSGDRSKKTIPFGLRGKDSDLLDEELLGIPVTCR